MQIDILPYAKERIPDVINFEENLRRQENFWGWKIDQAYRENVEKSFCSPEFSHSISLLAYVEGKVVGRIDSGMIATHFEGSRQAYLDWVCVLKDTNIRVLPKKLMKALREQLKQQGNHHPGRADCLQRRSSAFFCARCPTAKSRMKGFGLTFSSRNFPIIYYKRKATVQLHSRLPFYIR